ncbi:hypothetical protein [Armatimonas sp.]|uniref:hypothetical protein n=1 Tax=Armatimonas sp. TaxID=1872638 RepID=UPI003750C6AF
MRQNAHIKQQEALLRHRWLYVAQNLQVEQNVSKVVELLKRIWGSFPRTNALYRSLP